MFCIGEDCSAVSLQKTARPVNCVPPFTVDYECKYECDTEYTLGTRGTRCHHLRQFYEDLCEQISDNCVANIVIYNIMNHNKRAL